ncbi:MAG: 50S ribosomal protein L30 [Candidatus Hadarchaeales archaeon]
MPMLAVVRLKGSVGGRKKVLDTLRMLGLTRPNHCVLVEDTPSYRGMLRVAKDFITWGEVNPATVERLLRKRGEVRGGARLTDEYVKKHSPHSSISELAVAMCRGKVQLPGLKRVFRLHPPRKGLISLKHTFGHGGDLGYRGEAINELLLRMI